MVNVVNVVNVVNMINVIMLLYEVGIRLLVVGIRVAAFFNSKARLWVEGRRNWRERVNPTPDPSPTGRGDVERSATNATERSTVFSSSPLPVGEGSGVGSKTLWIHVSSLGEFEQGRPVIEAFREQFPDWRIVLTFFSPSGYEIRKNYPPADFVCYLPADTRRNAHDFLDLIHPDAAIFVKYDFWANYLFELQKRGIPTLLVSALFRENQPFFRWYGGLWRRMLGCFTHFFVQNPASENLLRGIGFQNITVAGDTRVDRVLKIAERAPENKIVAAFRESPAENGVCDLLIAGSTWPQDESLIAEGWRQSSTDDMKVVFAPHDPSPKSVSQIIARLPHDEFGTTLSYSQATPETAARASHLIIDNVGLLNTLYRYGTVAYIGGGFGKGIHNTLEPAAFGLPIIFGPKYEKFEEARQFVSRGGAFPVHSAEELALVLKKLEDPGFYEKASQAVKGYLEENKGATKKILAYIGKML